MCEERLRKTDAFRAQAPRNATAPSGPNRSCQVETFRYFLQLFFPISTWHAQLSGHTRYRRWYAGRLAGLYISSQTRQHSTSIAGNTPETLSKANPCGKLCPATSTSESCAEGAAGPESAELLGELSPAALSDEARRARPPMPSSPTPLARTPSARAVGTPSAPTTTSSSSPGPKPPAGASTKACNCRRRPSRSPPASRPPKRPCRCP